jgi:hypothetical protein
MFKWIHSPDAGSVYVCCSAFDWEPIEMTKQGKFSLHLSEILQVTSGELRCGCLLGGINTNSLLTDSGYTITPNLPLITTGT